MTFENVWPVCDSFVRNLNLAFAQHFNCWFVDAVRPVSVDSEPVQFLVISVQSGHVCRVVDLLVNEHMLLVWWDILVYFIVGEQKVLLFFCEFNLKFNVDRLLRPLLQRIFKLSVLLLNLFENFFLLPFYNFAPFFLLELLQSFLLELLYVNVVQFLLLFVDITLFLQFLIFYFRLYGDGCAWGGLLLLLFSTNHLTLN